jgi:hypothetical protein
MPSRRLATLLPAAPVGLQDASLDRALVAGSAADTLAIEPATWLPLAWSAEP